jgi:ATP diphosphatase
MTKAGPAPDPGDIVRLLEIMARLRDPAEGCPWDRVQTNESIASYTIEEAYEVAEAIGEGDTAALRDELGDLLFQVVFYAQIAAEAGEFTFADVVDGIADKMVRRHPHVFAGATVADADAQIHAWETDKKKEREARARTRGEAPSALDGVPAALPALARALKLQKRAAQLGFDWPDAAGAYGKLREEVSELAAATEGADPEAVAAELGDVLFSWVNVARFHGVDPESALRGANAKFIRRFRHIEAALAAEGRAPESATLEEMEALWQQAKAEEPA